MARAVCDLRRRASCTWPIACVQCSNPHVPDRYFGPLPSTSLSALMLMRRSTPGCARCILPSFATPRLAADKGWGWRPLLAGDHWQQISCDPDLLIRVAVLCTHWQACWGGEAVGPRVASDRGGSGWLGLAREARAGWVARGGSGWLGVARDGSECKRNGSRHM